MVCGRYALYSNFEEIKQHFAINNNIVFKPHYNICPEKTILTLIQPNIISFRKWGFSPKWLNSKSSFKNAKIETILEKPCFKEAIKKRRCLIPANGFFEWKLMPNGRKQPFYFTINNQNLFAFAGIWEDDSLAILTTNNKNEKISALERIPLIINPNQYSLWLSKNKDINNILNNITPTVNFKFFPVSTQMNNPEFDNINAITSL